MNTFNQLGLSETVLEVLTQIGFETPTPIQEEAIPMLLENAPTDFIGLAQTGTGKTAAFGLPLLELVDEFSGHPQALIMAPTRELGQQIAQQLVEFASNRPRLNVEVVYGGTSIYNQIKALRRPVQIVVATPGRLLDLIRRDAIHLDQVEYVVLDEADEMLNMGFQEDIDAILEHTGDERSIWLFSATMPQEIRNIVQNYMDEPREVKVNTKEISNADITHQYALTKGINKLKALRRYLDIAPDMKGILFCRTKRETEQIAEELAAQNYNVAALNGDLSQAQRDKVMRMFKARSMQLLIATDVAARGIDVKELTHVIHHNLPDQIEYYTHRSGRTGRAGRKGISLALVSPRDMRRIRDVERRIKIEFERVMIPTHQEVVSNRLRQWAGKLGEVPLRQEATELVAELDAQFQDMDKEDLLRLLVSHQLNELEHQGGYRGDLNVEERPHRGGRYGGRDGGSNRYFINLGRMDGVDKAGLVQFLSDTSGVNKNCFGDISLQKKCAYFDLDPEHDRGFMNRFKYVEVEGRRIRVNRDLAANRPPKSKGKFRSFKGGRDSGYPRRPGGGRKHPGKGKFGGKKKRY